MPLLLLHVFAAMISYGSPRKLLGRHGVGRLVAHGLAPQSTTSTAANSNSRGRILGKGRMQPWSIYPIRDNRPVRHLKFVSRLDVAKFAFAEMSSGASLSSAPSSASSSVATSSIPTPAGLGDYDIRCSMTGRVVCERVVDLYAPEGRCIGYAVPALLAEDGGSNENSESSQGSSRDSLSCLGALESPRHWIREYLHPLEVEHGMDVPSGVGRTSFLLGRLALRQALECVARMDDDDGGAHSPATVPFRSSSPNFADWVLLKDAHGRPNVPRGFLGSVSHKKNVAVALVARDGSTAEGAHLDRPLHPHDTSKPLSLPVPVSTRGIGVDLEAAAPRNKISIARKVLTVEEINALGSVPVRTSAWITCVERTLHMC